MSPTWEENPDARSGVSFAVPSPGRMVRALLIANIALFVLQWVVLDGTFPATFTFFLDTFALDPKQWLHFPLAPLWQLVSYGFLHGGPAHLLFNMLFLYFLGTMLEGELGERRFISFYLVAVALSGACQLALGLALGQYAPIVGASGGLMAVVCAMATLRPQTRLIFILVPVTLRTVALIYIALEMFGAISQLKGQESNVASFAHLSGALFGFLCARYGWIWRDPLEAVADWRDRRAEVQRSHDAERLDRLLEKINREGLKTLSGSERAFLKRVAGKR